MKRILLGAFALSLTSTAYAQDLPQIVETDECPVSEFVQQKGPEYLETLEAALTSLEATPATFIVIEVGHEKAIEGNPNSMAALVRAHLQCRDAETVSEYISRKSEEYSSGATE